MNRPGIAKLRILDKVITKLKNHTFADRFLDHDGLNIISKFISKLPDGSWPLSNVRNKVLKLIHSLPSSVDHLRNTDLGKTLNILQNSPKELSENKKVIQSIKDKWSRIICNIPVEYTNLEQCERSFNTIPFTYRQTSIDDDIHLGKRHDSTEDELNQNLSYSLSRPKNLGYNFSIRPSNSVSVSSKRIEDSSDLQNHLMRIRRATKKL